MLRIISSREREAVASLIAGRTRRLAEAERTVAPILEAVRHRGDEALRAYARRWDGLDGDDLRLPESRLQQAARSLPPELARAVRSAAARIRAYAERQLPQEWLKPLGEGIEVGQLVRPLDSVAAYVPGGRYPLPSTVLMTVVPAQAAGVGRIAVTSPRPSPATLGAVGLLGVREAYAVGGAHAIAAFAFGTETIARADRIVGPGNIYVAAAKKLLAGETGIDFVAGPTEILLLYEHGDARLLAADMLAQAEHDTDAAAVLLTTSRPLAEAVRAEIQRQLPTLPTRKVAAHAISRHSAAVVTSTLDEACDIANRFAPEHLAVSEGVPLSSIRHAGSVFVGSWSPEAAGDYASGPNHVLPTGGRSRLRGGLSALDFVKVISVQRLSERGLRELAPAVTTLARAEGLEAHARSIEARTGPVAEQSRG